MSKTEKEKQEYNKTVFDDGEKMDVTTDDIIHSIYTPEIYGAYGLYRVRKNDRLSFMDDVNKYRRENVTHLMYFNDNFSSVFFHCEECNNKIHVSFTTIINNKIICDSCKKEHYQLCTRCQRYTDDFKIVRTNNGKHLIYCEYCAKHYTTKCQHCKTPVYGMSICEDCQTLYDNCLSCGNYILKDRLIESFCNVCYPSYIANKYGGKKKRINGYHSKPTPIFISTKEGCVDPFGVELEVDYGNFTDGLSHALNDYPEIYLEHDGSLSCGVEIITHPLSLDYHRDHMKWNEILSHFKNSGYKSHDTSTCGLHVHISRLSFGDTTRKQSKHLSYFLYLFQHFKTEMKKFSRRSEFRYCNFYNYDERNTITREYQRACYQRDRYTVVNFTNSTTIEIRLFKGTLNYETLIASLEMCKLFKDIATTVKNEDKLKSMSWTDVKGKITRDMVSLKAYLLKNNI